MSVISTMKLLAFASMLSAVPMRVKTASKGLHTEDHSEAKLLQLYLEIHIRGPHTTPALAAQVVSCMLHSSL